MPKPAQTKPFDVVVALRLLRPAATIASIAADLCAAPSQVHTALTRLGVAGLLKPGQRESNPRAILEFLAGGIRYAFPVERGPLATGLPTGYSAPPLNAAVDAIDVLVWPAPKLADSVQGFSITPLYPRAPLLSQHDPITYQMLCVVDVLRLGDHRLRQRARDALEKLINA